MVIVLIFSWKKYNEQEKADLKRESSGVLGQVVKGHNIYQGFSNLILGVVMIIFLPISIMSVVSMTGNTPGTVGFILGIILSIISIIAGIGLIAWSRAHLKGRTYNKENVK